MTRTVLFFWVYSLPLVLVGISDATDDRFYSIHDAIEVLLIMFFCTYGFLGLEYVCVELDDPYGDDPNDFCGMSSLFVYFMFYCVLFDTKKKECLTSERFSLLDQAKSGRSSPLRTFI